ncbi:hypothetical protein BU15DRAFT_62236 [Melanogaster broomeanus]|nr:hypothetical protein BU15DRAFT_62236 [Melanogaster broomeanus]
MVPIVRMMSSVLEGTFVSPLLTIPPFLASQKLSVLLGCITCDVRALLGPGPAPFPVYLRGTVKRPGFYYQHPIFPPSGVKYFRLFLRLMESSAGIGTLSWLANNLRGKYKPDWPVGRAIGSSFRSQDAPRFIYGSTGLVTVLITAITYKHINTAIGREELLQQQRAGKGELKKGGQGKRIGDGH